MGRAICRRALKMPKQVIGTIHSFSRRGVPEAASNGGNSWMDSERMKWSKLSEKDKHSKTINLETAIQESITNGEKFAVLCSVGALFENENYKKFLEKPEYLSPFAGKDEHQNTYESLNRDVCVSVVNTIEACLVKGGNDSVNADAKVPFVFISAFANPPGVSRKYISTKREAENYVVSKSNFLGPIILRPGFLYDESRPASMGIASALKLASSSSQFMRTFLKHSPMTSTLDETNSLQHLLEAYPLHVSEVADCIIKLLVDSTGRDNQRPHGETALVLEPKDIRRMSKRR